MKQTVAPSLPEEIIADILKRLPVKSLIRFRTVCKHWRNLLNTPSFIQDHLHHHSTHQKNPSLLIQPHGHQTHPFNLCLFDCYMQFHEVNIPPSIHSLMDKEVELVGSCNGLICLVQSSTYPPTPLLWNPATREVRHIPIHMPPITIDDPLYICWLLGFGFSSINNDYKIVRFCNDENICGVEVYSLNTGCWRNIHIDDSIKDFMTWSWFCVTINGAIFFNARQVVPDIDFFVIISFDLATEVFRVIPVPASSSHLPAGIDVYEDKLAIFLPDTDFFHLGVLEESGVGSSEERWSLRNKYNKYISTCDPSQIHLEIIWRNQFVFILPRERDLCLVNVTTNDLCPSACNYVESLVPIGNIQH